MAALFEITTREQCQAARDAIAPLAAALAAAAVEELSDHHSAAIPDLLTFTREGLAALLGRVVAAALIQDTRGPWADLVSPPLEEAITARVSAALAEQLPEEVA